MTATTFWKLETKAVGMGKWQGEGEEVEEIQKHSPMHPTTYKPHVFYLNLGTC